METKQSSESTIQSEAEAIVTEQTDVRDRVRNLVIQAIRDRGFEAGQLKTVLEDTTSGVATAIRREIPDEPTSVLRQVFDGLTEGVTVAVHAIRLAFEEAEKRGQKFTEEDLARARNELVDLEELFFSSISTLGQEARTHGDAQLADAVDHAKRTGTRIRPAIAAALEAALRHPIKLASEAVTTGVSASGKAAGVLAHAMSGMLQAAGDLLADSNSKKR